MGCFIFAGRVRGTYRLNCFIAALLHCSIKLLFPERVTPCSLSTYQVQHCSMKTSIASSTMPFRKALSLQNYKLELVLTIEMAGTVPHLVNLFTLRFAGLSYQAIMKDIVELTPFESRQCVFKIPPESCLTEMGGPAHTLFWEERRSWSVCYCKCQQLMFAVYSKIVRYGSAPILRQTINNFLHLSSIAGWFSCCFFFKQWIKMTQKWN